MRIATWNVAWFDTLFDDAGEPLLDDAPAEGVPGVIATRRQRLEAIALVMKRLDADALLVVEAPNTGRRRSTVRALERFAAVAGLRTRRALIGFPSPTHQEIALMWDPARLAVRHDPRGRAPGRRGLDEAPRFDGEFHLGAMPRDDAGRAAADGETITFSKPPLELAVHVPGGLDLRMIGVHVKSKAPHGAADPAEARRLAIAARIKQRAQCLWLRQRIDSHLARGEPLIVLGDFNDGPGLDDFEELAGPSAIEIVIGAGRPARERLFDPAALAALSAPSTARPTTARFRVEGDGGPRWVGALLDYILVSADLRPRERHWRIWHPFDDEGCYRDEPLRAALLDASDHFPVSLDIDLESPPEGGAA
ncbi:MAG: endonuclease [Alphaproteobacteria bacterium]|nr:MAG: endonuclease [Alphaproteobacteria bacterium]